MSGEHRRIRIGTRGSPLALAQTRLLADRLEAAGYEPSIVTIRTTGDAIRDIPVSDIGTIGVFTTALDQTLRAGEVDAAVHSLKDLPTVVSEDIAVVAVSERADPRDALVGRAPLRWADVPHEATIATSSRRRRAQLLHARPDLQVEDIRGNVDTRLNILDRTPRLAATVLAAAGLIRLERETRIGDLLPVAWMLPAPAQGALAVTARRDATAVAATIHQAFHHLPTALAVSAERTLLHALGAGCHAPLGAHAQWHGERAGSLTLTGRLLSLDGTRMIEASHTGRVHHESAAQEVGERVAEELRARGAEELLRAEEPSPASSQAPPPPPPSR